MVWRFIVILVAMHCTSHAAADEETEILEKIYRMAQNVVNTTTELQQKSEVFEARKGISPFLFPLWGFGGLHVFAILWAIKIKIVLIVAAVGFAIFYYTKFLALKKKLALSVYGKYSGYPSGIRDGGVYEAPYPLGGYGYPTGYSNLLDIASYDTPEPYSGYYPDIEHDYGHHLHYDHGHGHEIYHDHSDHHHEHDHTISDAPVAQAAAENSQPSAAPARRRRVGRQRRSAGDDADQRIEFINLGELAFSFLGVHTEGCRRRFVCELDFRARVNPVTRLAFSFIGRSFFEQYRDVEGVDEKPKVFGDCARMFNDCRDAEKYNNTDDDDDEEEVAANNDYPDAEASTEKSIDDEKNDEGSESNRENANEVRHMRQSNGDVAHYVQSHRATKLMH